MDLKPIELHHGEQWRGIPGVVGYEASDFGRIRSLPRRIRLSTGRVMSWKGRVLKPWKGKNGYLQVVSGQKRCVHELVLRAWHGPRPAGYTASHLNGVRHDNRQENQIWESMRDNFSRQIEHGTRNRGERQGNVRLTEAQAKIIKAVKNPERGWYACMAKLYGVHPNTIRDAHQGRTWRHL